MISTSLPSQQNKESAQPPQKAPDPDANTALEQERYAAMFKQLDKEAIYTLGAAILITVVFWLAIFFTKDSSTSIFNMPLWFVLSCLGGYVLSVVVVIALVKLGMKNMPLHPDAITQSTKTNSNQSSSTGTPDSTHKESM